MANQFIGNSCEGGYEIQFDPHSGFQSTRRFRGTQAYIAAQEIQMILMGYRTSVRQGAVWELEATVSGDIRTGGGQPIDEPVNTWELVPNSVEKDILSSDAQVVGQISEPNRLLLSSVIAGKWDVSGPEPAFTGPDADYAIDLYHLITAGTKSKTIFQPILRHQQTVSSSYPISSSLFRVGWIFSTARLQAIEPIPVSIRNNMLASEYIFRSDGVSIYKGWFKVHPTIQIVSYNKAQLSQEWQWGHWAVPLFMNQFDE